MTINTKLLEAFAKIIILVGVPLLMHLTALFWARFEIQCEGRFPWAGSLPCWKRRTGFKEITGYHTNLSYLFLALVLLVVVFFSAFVSGNLLQDTALLATVLSIFPLGKILGILFIFISCFILIVGDEDSMWNTIHPSRKFTIKAYTRKQFPAAGLVWLIPRDYFYYVIFSGLFYGLASIIAGYSMWLWLWYLIAIIFMNLITIPIEQAKNKKMGAAEIIEKFARQHAFFEGTLDEKGNLIEEKAKIIVIRKKEGKYFIGIEDVEIIDPRGRYSLGYSQGNENPDTLENRINQKVSPEITSLLEEILAIAEDLCDKKTDPK